MKNRVKLFPIMGVILLLTFSFLGMICIPEWEEGGTLLLRTALSGPSKAVLLVNRFILNNTDQGNFQETQKKSNPKKEKRSKFSEFLFFILNAVLMTSEKQIIFLAMLFVGIGLKFTGTLYNMAIRGAPDIPNLRYYQQWCLKFLTPLQKCIESIAQKYDINPIFNVLGSLKPALLSFRI